MHFVALLHSLSVFNKVNGVLHSLIVMTYCSLTRTYFPLNMGIAEPAKSTFKDKLHALASKHSEEKKESNSSDYLELFQDIAGLLKESAEEGKFNRIITFHSDKTKAKEVEEYFRGFCDWCNQNKVAHTQLKSISRAFPGFFSRLFGYDVTFEFDWADRD